eukprot:g296.t1
MYLCRIRPRPLSGTSFSRLRQANRLTHQQPHLQTRAFSSGLPTLPSGATNAVAGVPKLAYDYLLKSPTGFTIFVLTGGVLGTWGYNAVFDGLWGLNNRGKSFEEVSGRSQFKFYLDDDDDDDDDDDEDEEDDE